MGALMSTAEWEIKRMIKADYTKDMCAQYNLLSIK
jgi:hypothetical protein